MAYESAIWLTGNSTNAAETISTTNATRVGTALSPNRLYIAEARCGTPTGTSPTVDLVIESSATGSTAWSVLATFPQITTTMTVLNPESTAAVTQGAVLRRAFRVSEERPYIHLKATTGGTTPVFPGVSVVVVIPPGAQGAT